MKRKLYYKLKKLNPLRRLIVAIKYKILAFKLNFHGFKTLKKISNIFELSNINYSLSFGTLLGFYRDRRFIKHDVDIDLMIFKENGIIDLPNYEKLINELSKQKFRIVRRDYDKKNIKLKFKGISIDISILEYDYQKKKYNFYSSYPNLDMDFSDEIIIDEYKLPIPKNTREFLEKMYGKKWRIPDKIPYESNPVKNKF